MDKYNLYLEGSYDENVKQIRTKMSKPKNLITKFKEKCLYGSFVRQRLNAIKYICSEIMNRNKILNHFTTRSVLQAYIMLRHPNCKPTFYHTLRCYDFCYLILRFSNAKHEKIILDELFNSCPTYYWENKMKNLFIDGKLGDNDKIILEDLMNMCSYDLINSKEFKSFLRDLKNETKMIKNILILIKKEQDKILKIN